MSGANGPNGTQGTIWGAKIECRSSAHKENALPPVLSLQFPLELSSHVRSFFDLIALDSISLSLVFVTLIIMCLGGFLFRSIFIGTFLASWISTSALLNTEKCLAMI